ncbi:germination protein YpeB [Oscillospiraceae bacterium PP1C4]
MRFSIARRNFIRIISYTLTLVLVLGGLAWMHNATAIDYKRQLEYTYTRSLGELSSYLTNISTDLNKGQYVGTSNQLAQMSARIWRASGSAKSALSTLPVSDLHMDNTYKFLSQVGDYAMVLSKKVANGGVLTEEEKNNAKLLNDYSSKLRTYIDDVQQQIHNGQINVTAMRTLQPNEHDSAQGTQTSTGIASGFKDVEDTMTGYPTLIYDGPFSDHLLTKEPQLTRGLKTVSPGAALEKAARAARVNPEDLKQSDDENSNMPSYTFTGNNISVAVTKAGGLVTYMLHSREVGEQRLNRNAVFEKATQYLAALGIKDLRPTYYETSDGICTVNYAAVSGDVILYTDLIKVGVALDDGGVVFYDARGYVNNHKERTLKAPTLSVEQASKSVNPSLKIKSNRLALIPTSGQNEVLTYEFQAETAEGQKLLVYVNTDNGQEEQILLLIQTTNGTMTK